MASVISAGLTTTTSLSFSGDTSGVLQLQTNGTTTAVTIDTAQNVGIGVTPSAWTSSYKAIDVNSTGASLASGSFNAIVGNNAYYNGSSWIYKGTGYASDYLQNSAGQHVWRIAGSGSAGGSITYTSAMTLDNSGNLLVGAGTTTTRISAGSGQFSTSAGLYIFSGSLNDNSYLSRASAGTGTTTWYIGNAQITTVSDVRLKENIVDTQRNALEILGQLRVVDHTWNDPSDQCENNRNSRGAWMGLIAQEAQPIIPWLVNKPKEDIDKDGNPQYWHMDYGYSVPLLIKAIQELSAKVTALEAKVGV